MKQKQFNDFKTITERVRFLLETRPQLRDNAMALVANYHYLELGKDAVDEMTANDFLAKLALVKVTSFDSIDRAKRKLQQENEELRGSMYKVKKKIEIPFFIVNKRD